MKTLNLLSNAAIALLISAAVVYANPVAYAQILKERDAVLSKIVAELQSRHASGADDDEAVFTAQLALHAFRRDTAAKTDKARHQEQVVQLHEKRVARIKARAQTGASDSIRVLRATDALLEARQLLEELRSSDKRG